MVPINHNDRGTPLIDTSGMAVENIGGAYRFVCHANGIATTGFRKVDALHRNGASFLGTEKAL
jgi:hypothetical protein